MTDLAGFIGRCESLGRNCEFGYLQRHLGAEPIGLLRWAGAPMEAVIAGLESDFRGIGDRMEFWRDPSGEWWGKTLGLTFHTGVGYPQHAVEVAHSHARRRLPRLAEMLMDTIREGRKPLIYSSAGLTAPDDAYPLLDAIRSAGGFGPVLIVAAGANEPVRQFDTMAWGARVPVLTTEGDAVSGQTEPWLRVLAEFAAVLALAHHPTV
jgi:hypothetical protein